MKLRTIDGSALQSVWRVTSWCRDSVIRNASFATRLWLLFVLRSKNSSIHSLSDHRRGNADTARCHQRMTSHATPVHGRHAQQDPDERKPVDVRRTADSAGAAMAAFQWHPLAGGCVDLEAVLTFASRGPSEQCTGACFYAQQQTGPTQHITRISHKAGSIFAASALGTPARRRQERGGRGGQTRRA